jgi:hypothetical protein
MVLSKVSSIKQVRKFLKIEENVGRVKKHYGGIFR